MSLNLAWKDKVDKANLVIYTDTDIIGLQEFIVSLTKKAMILFDPDQYRKLEEKAKLRGKSVGALVREAVEEVILAEDEVSRKARIEAARRIVSAQEELLSWEEIEELIARGHGK